jgi:hypothetical protein
MELKGKNIKNKQVNIKGNLAYTFFEDSMIKNKKLSYIDFPQKILVIIFIYTN